MTTLPTNHADGVGEIIAASIINNIAAQVNANTTAIAAGSTPSGAAGGSLAGTYPNPTLAAGAVTGAALGTDVAKLVAGKISPASQIQQVIATTDLTDVVSPQTAVKGQTLVWSDDSPPKLFYISHKRNLRGYRAFTGDGTTDDSTAVNQAVTDASTRGYVEAPPGVTIRVKNITLASNVIFDGNGSVFKLASSATSVDDVFRSINFNALTGGGTTSGVYLPKLQHMRIDGNGQAGRHGIACYGVPRFEDLIVHSCGGSAVWAEWSTTSSSLSAAGLADGDQTGFFNNIMAYDCSLNTNLPSTYNATLQGPTTATWAANVITFNFSTAHLRRVGDVVVVAGYTPSGYNGTYTIATVPTTTSFTVAQATSLGANTVVGTVAHQTSAMIAILGMDSPFVRDLDIYQTLSVVPGSRGLTLGNSGSALQNVHVYQNFATGLDICNGQNTRIEGFYCGGHDQGILIRQNQVQMTNWFVSGSFNNSIGIDYQSIGGTCQIGQGRIDSLTSGSTCVRLWNTSHVYGVISCVGDGGSNTSTLYTAPNGSTGFHGAIYNLGFGVNASPASLVNYT